jgi:hypothetical protein
LRPNFLEEAPMWTGRQPDQPESRRRLSESEYEKIVADIKARVEAGESEASFSKELVEAGKRFTGRECGDCSLCCKVLDIDVPELQKPPGAWCQHCSPGRGGCGIYETRPDICRGFACGWLVIPWLGEEWKPSLSKIVVHHKRAEGGRVDCHFIVDQSVPERWREAPYHDEIRQIAFSNLNTADGPHMQTYVKVRGRSILVLPQKEVDVTDCPHVVFNTGSEWEWEVVKFKTKTEAQKFEQATTKLMSLPSHERERIAELMMRGYT